ncbi:MAG: universal stress protein [Caldilineaceae bacterium]
MLPADVYVSGVPMAGSCDAYSRAIESGYNSLEQEREAYRAELHDSLRIEAERLRAVGYTVTTEVQFGDPAQRIIEFVSEGNVQMVAMATHGRSGLGRLVLGSVAENVLRGVNVPVLLMRTSGVGEVKEAPGDQLARSLGSGHTLSLAVVTDGSTHGRQAIDVAAGLSRLLETKLTMLVVANEREGGPCPATHGRGLCAGHRRGAVARSRAVGGLRRRRSAALPGQHARRILLGRGNVPRDRGASSSAAIGATAHRATCAHIGPHGQRTQARVQAHRGVRGHG